MSAGRGRAGPHRRSLAARRMPRRLRVLAAVALLLCAATPAAVLAAGAPAWSHRVAVSVPWHPPSAHPVRVAFHPRAALPRRGYYYAVAVLVHYRHPAAGPPECAVSSNMDRTQYGHGGRDGRVRLTLLPAASVTAGWCPRGLYEGAVYAVPHRPPCTRAYPCYGRSSCGPAGGFCGVIPYRLYEYSYPSGLPKPLDSSTRIVGRFTIHVAGVSE